MKPATPPEHTSASNRSVKPRPLSLHGVAVMPRNFASGQRSQSPL